MKIISFNVRVRYFVWNFKGCLWNSTQNILPYIERCRVYTRVKIKEPLDLRAHKCLWPPWIICIAVHLGENKSTKNCVRQTCNGNICTFVMFYYLKYVMCIYIPRCLIIFFFFWNIFLLVYLSAVDVRLNFNDCLTYLIPQVVLLHNKRNIRVT